MELEDYSTIQRPRNITEIWNDERDPERLLTFKALVIVGGISIFLSILSGFSCNCTGSLSSSILIEGKLFVNNI
jgi:hypothetical protein